MTGNHGTPNHHSGADRTGQASRKISRSGIPPFAPAPRQAEAKLSEPIDSFDAVDSFYSVDYPASDYSSADSASTPSAVTCGSAIPVSVSPATASEPASSEAKFSRSPDEKLPGRELPHVQAIDLRVPRPPMNLPQVHLPKSWLFWSITAVVAFSGLGITSALVLFRLPSMPNCPAIFWPTASASLRLYCAQLSAERQTVDDLLKAIALVNSLPENHALRSEVDRNIEAWAKEVLQLADTSFQQGDLSKAIATAKRIPKNTEAHQLIDQQVEDWKTTWTKAEGIYKESVAALGEQDLRQAFSIATRLLGVDNDYWQTTKYEELNALITTTRQDADKLGKAQGFADQGGLANLLEALKLAQEVESTSPLYAKAQKLVATFGQDMLDLAQTMLDQRKYDQSIAIVEQIPDKAGLQSEIRDFRLIAEAQAQAWGGTPDDLEAAIVRVQKIGRDRPLYSEAQQLVAYWQLEIQDVQRLRTAQQIAQGSTVADLRAAIAEAQLIPFSNPRGNEAQEQIASWTTTIETIEDRPYLDRAEQLAGRGDIAALQSAIDEVNRIGRGRALSEEAANRVAQWQGEIQRIQDRPLLDRARLLATNGNLMEAIALAEQISSGRALYDDAQAEIASWSSQIQRSQDQPLLDLARRYANQGNLAQAISVAEQIDANRALYAEAQAEVQVWRGQFTEADRMRQAQNSASVGTPAMLLSAIRVANDIPDDNPSRAEANQMINQWSWQLLEIARSQANVDLPGAIATAGSIPDYSEAYTAAQQQIQDWQKQNSRNPASPRIQF